MKYPTITNKLLNILRNSVLFISLLIIFTACGGGGGGGGGDVGGDLGDVVVGDGGDEDVGDEDVGDDDVGDGDGDGDGDEIPTYTISGTISLSQIASVDSDTNDPNGPEESNDSIANAQSIQNYSLVGGFVNAPGTGDSNGRFYSSGDESDYYSVTLSGNENIVLYIADYAETGVDLDLYLYDSSGTELKASTGTSNSETINISTSGDYYVEVYNYSGASNYILSISPFSSSSADAQLVDIKDDFRPGEVIIKFREADGVNQKKSMAFKASSLGMNMAAGDDQRPSLLTFKSESDKENVFQALGISEKTKNSIIQKFAGESFKEKQDTLEVIKALRKRSDVVFAEPNYKRTAFKTPDDTYYNNQWHYPLINLPQAWDVNDGSSDVIVAVIDTGVLLSHPDLQGKLVGGYDFINDISTSNDGDGIDSNPDDPGDGGAAAASSFHGTHVAGTIAANTNNNTGVSGVSWNSKIMPLRVLGVGGGYSYDIIQAIYFAAGLTNDSGTIPPVKADVMNLSLGGVQASAAEQAAYTDARNAGVIIIAAAGNENTSQLSYPASYDGVVSVSAVDWNRERAPYSNFGTEIDVTAPGGNQNQGNDQGILSTCGDDSGSFISFNYTYYQGTSMAAPHVAGVAALMKSVDVGMTPAVFDTYLLNGDLTVDIGDTGRDNLYGYGLIDAYKAVVKANEHAGGGALPEIMLVSPMSLNYKFTETSMQIAVTNGTGADLADVTASADVSWLTINKISNNSFTAVVDRTPLTAGYYTGVITFQTTTPDVDDVSISAIMQVSGATTNTPDAGYHYIGLYHPAGTSPAYSTVATAVNGQYSFSISGIESGTYYILAGSDFDNDFFLGDSGESVGLYPNYDQPSEITISSDMTGLDFNSNFTVRVPEVAGLENLLKSKSGFTGRIFERVKE